MIQREPEQMRRYDGRRMGGKAGPERGKTIGHGLAREKTGSLVRGFRVYIQRCNIDVKRTTKPASENFWNKVCAVKSHSRPEPPVALSSI